MAKFAGHALAAREEAPIDDGSPSAARTEFEKYGAIRWQGRLGIECAKSSGIGTVPNHAIAAGALGKECRRAHITPAENRRVEHMTVVTYQARHSQAA